MKSINIMKRRELIKGLSILPLAAVGVGGIGLSTASSKSKAKSIYESIGVRPLINARGTVTIVGASKVLPEVQLAMDEAVKNYVQIDEMMEGVGRRLAQLTGTENGIVTSGASGAITLGTAACVSGGDPDKLWQLPDLSGMKNEVIIPAYSRTAYDASAKAVGVKMVEVSTLEELKLAINPRTAMILVLAGARSENGPLSLREISSLIRPLGIPILVDAAAEGLEVPNPHITQGADLVAYSGGKYLGGPQCAGLLIGRDDLIRASWMVSAPHHGFGRGFKVGREEVMGMLTAAEMWMKRDHKKEMAEWNTALQYISKRLEKLNGITNEIRQPIGRSNPSPSLTVRWDINEIPLTGDDVEHILWNGTPRIAVSGAGSFLPFPPNMQPNISINTSQLDPGEEKIIADRVFAILSKPPVIKRPTAPAGFDISGEWDLEMSFSASVVNQTLVFEQKDSALRGTHFASIGSREINGTLHGNEILIRSSYKLQGMRINYEFSGIVNGDEMEGKVSLSEYGMASWKAKRHQYKS